MTPILPLSASVGGRQLVEWWSLKDKFIERVGVRVYSKTVSADIVKLLILKWGDNPGLMNIQVAPNLMTSVHI